MFAQTVALLSLLAFAIPAHGDWPHWRGTQRSGVVTAHSGWDGEKWIAGEQWRFSAGEGSSSPIIVDQQVFLTGWADGSDSIICLDRNTGRELWRQSYASPRYGRFSMGDKAFYSGACSTPEYDSDSGLLFTLGIDGDLNVWDTRARGARVWNLNIYDKYGAQQRPEVAKRKRTQRDYGYTTSPLVMGNQVVVEVGGNTGNLVAFDKRTGREIWTGSA